MPVKSHILDVSVQKRRSKKQSSIVVEVEYVGTNKA
jgi:hypothetical protein